MSQTGRQRANRVDDYLNGDNACNWHCDPNLEIVEEFVEHDSSKNKNGGNKEPDYLHSTGTSCDPEVFTLVPDLRQGVNEDGRRIWGQVSTIPRTSSSS